MQGEYKKAGRCKISFRDPNSSVSLSKDRPLYHELAVVRERKLKSKCLLPATATIQNLCVTEALTLNTSLETADMKSKGGLVSI